MIYVSDLCWKLMTAHLQSHNINYQISGCTLGIQRLAFSRVAMRLTCFFHPLAHVLLRILEQIFKMQDIAGVENMKFVKNLECNMPEAFSSFDKSCFSTTKFDTYSLRVSNNWFYFLGGKFLCENWYRYTPPNFLK